MEISFIKHGYHNEHHIEIWPTYFSFSPLFWTMLKFWFPYGYMMPEKKSLAPRSHAFGHHILVTSRPKAPRIGGLL
jgi:hypothetical protein